MFDCRTVWIAAAWLTLGACTPALEDTADGSARRFTPAGTGGGSADAAAVLAALDIEALHVLAAAELPAGDYWVEDPAAQSERIERILAAERSARAALLEGFGSSVVQAAAFRGLFQPLHERMPRLSSAQQIAIHELERRYVAARLGAGSADGFTEHLARIRERLGEAIAKQYALHASPLAVELRSAGVSLSEDEFRDAFDILDARDSGQGAFLAARRLLRQRLGTERFVRLWAQRDPRFTKLRATAMRLGLTSEVLFSVYSLLLDNEDAMLAAADTAHPDAASAQRGLREIYDDARRRLIELIGEPAAETVLRSFSAASAGVSDTRR